MKDNKTQVVSLRIEKYVKERVSEMAVADGRSFTNMVQKILKDHADSYEEAIKQAVNK